MRFLRNLWSYLSGSTNIKERSLMFNYLDEIRESINLINNEMQTNNPHSINAYNELIRNKISRFTSYRDNISQGKNFTYEELKVFDRYFNNLADKYRGISIKKVV